MPQTFPSPSSMPRSLSCDQQNVSTLCPLALSSKQSDLHLPLTFLHLPTLFSSSRQGFDFRRVLALQVFHNSMGQQAVQRSLSRLGLCLLVKLAACRKAFQVSSAASLSKIPFSSVSQFPASSSVEAFATKSSAGQYFSASSSSSFSFVSLRPSDPSWCCCQCPKSDLCSSTYSSLRQPQDPGSCF